MTEEKKNLLAPTGALIVMMVYYIYIRSGSHFFRFSLSPLMQLKIVRTCEHLLAPTGALYNISYDVLLHKIEQGQTSFYFIFGSAQCISVTTVTQDH